MSVTSEDLRETAKAIGYGLKENEVEDYTTLLAKMKQALDAVSAMEGNARNTYE